MKNKMSVVFSSISENEAFARVTVAAFIAQIDPSMDELTEIKTVVSEAVTNSIIHGYQNSPNEEITIDCEINDGEVFLVIEDNGIGIEDISEAREPLYTSKPEMERSGMGFTIMENFMDHVSIHSSPGEGTRLEMSKQLVKQKTVYN